MIYTLMKEWSFMELLYPQKKVKNIVIIVTCKCIAGIPFNYPNSFSQISIVHSKEIIKYLTPNLIKVNIEINNS